MAESATLSLQKAIRDTLLANTPLLALLGGPRVHDHAPQAGALPFVVFDGIESRDEGSQYQVLDVHEVTLSIWSEAEGVKQVREIIAEIEAALANQPLTLSGHRFIDLRSIGSTTVRIDGLRRRGTLRLRAVSEPL